MIWPPCQSASFPKSVSLLGANHQDFSLFLQHHAPFSHSQCGIVFPLLANLFSCQSQFKCYFPRDLFPGYQTGYVFLLNTSIKPFLLCRNKTLYHRMILAFSFSTAKECAYLSIPLSHLQGEFGHAVQEDRSGEETRR